MVVENDLLLCESAVEWRAWLEANHDTSPGVWLLIAKKGSGVDTVSYSDAVDEALCFGWIDGQKGRYDDSYFRQRFTRRVKRSPWSKINTERATRPIDAKRMRPAGRREVDAAKADGRWDAAYAGQANATVPDPGDARPQDRRVRRRSRAGPRVPPQSPLEVTCVRRRASWGGRERRRRGPGRAGVHRQQDAHSSWIRRV